MTSDSGAPDQSPEPQGEGTQGGGVPQRRSTRKRNGAWLYIILGVVIGAVGLVGLFSDDSGILDWLLILLGVINLAIGIRVLTAPDEPFYDAPEDQSS